MTYSLNLRVKIALMDYSICLKKNWMLRRKGKGLKTMKVLKELGNQKKGVLVVDLSQTEYKLGLSRQMEFLYNTLP